MPNAHPLGETAPSSDVVVERISDADSQLLQYFSDHGIVVGARLHVTGGDPFSDTIEVSAGPEAKTVVLGSRASGAVWVSAA